MLPPMGLPWRPDEARVNAVGIEQSNASLALAPSWNARGRECAASRSPCLNALHARLALSAVLSACEVPYRTQLELLSDDGSTLPLLLHAAVAAHTALGLDVTSRERTSRMGSCTIAGAAVFAQITCIYTSRMRGAVLL